MTTHQIWSCHVTLAANFENFYFSPNFILNFRKVTKFGENWLKNKKVTAKSKTRGGKHPPPCSAYKVKLKKAYYTCIVCLYPGHQVSVSRDEGSCALDFSKFFETPCRISKIIES